MPTEKPIFTDPLELWGGVECSVNRVGEEYFDQLELSGHARRLDDLDLFASLGVRAMRYPVLWERTAPHGLEQVAWSWADERLARLQELNIRPIVGLVHHGSGTRDTSLVDPLFPEKLARYAVAVASRYPWIEDYTPINEPLTTARFSGLYGHWYPHGTDDKTFARAFINQCRATVLAMRAIRKINPSARLVQTEDLGKTYSTPALSYQAEFENERRWLTFDLLIGKIDRAHALRGYLLWAGITDSEIEWFGENVCPPDVLGINHYITSERFLDHRLERYPAQTHGGNGRAHYSDVEAVRVCSEGVAGVRVLLREAWERYGRTLAVTETHIGCTREEQMRWFKEIWDAAQSLKAEGADVCAVTAWSLVGAHDWNSLVTCAQGCYEPGVFDARTNDDRPRPTALAALIRDLAAGRENSHPLLETPGWWRRLDRLQYPPVSQHHPTNVSITRSVSMNKIAPRPLLITGATGTLGRHFARLCETRGIAYRLLSRGEMDIACAESVQSALAEFNPWAVINTAGYVRVDDAEREPEKCFRENTEGARTLAHACAANGIKLLTFSSDLVFDGASETPYLETSPVHPLNVYGRSKAEAEQQVMNESAAALIIRTSAFFSPWDEHNFITVALRELSAGREFIAASDSIVSPTYVPDLVNASLDLLIDGERGVWHLANAGAISWFDLARRAAAQRGLDVARVVPRTTAELQLAAPRPAYSVLGSERSTGLLPSLEDALERYFAETYVCDAARTEQQSPLIPLIKPVARTARAG